MSDIPIEIIKLTTLIAEKPELLKDLHIHQSRLVRLADHLISNGVTVQKWIPVSERLPERTLPPRDVLVYHDLGCGMFVDRAWYSYDVGKWRSVLGMKLKVTHWMPLPEPPSRGDEVNA